MQLVLDTGNTFEKCAVFDGDAIAEIFSGMIDEKILLHFRDTFPVTHYISATVTYKNHDFATIFPSAQGFTLNSNTPLPITNRYATPETLGNDRLANAVGASFLFPDKNVLVIDAGTCIKYDFITSEKEYTGGAISPGIAMRLTAMHNYTAKLPLLSPDRLMDADTVPLTGDSTQFSLLSGAGNGALLEAEGMIGEYQKRYENLQVILTGGDAPFFEKHLKKKIFAHPNLVLFGLHKILDHSVKHVE